MHSLIARRIPTASQVTLRCLLMALGAVWLIPPANAADQLPRITNPAAKEIQAGGEITVSLNRALSDDFVPQVKIGDQTSDLVQVSNDRKTITVRVPAELISGQTHEGDYKLTLSVTPTKGGETVSLGGQTILTVYPEGSPEAQSINDVPFENGPIIFTGDTFTVRGSGFFAPASAITFSVRVKGKEVPAVAKSVATDGKSFTAAFVTGKDLEPGNWPSEITVWGRAARTPAYGYVWIEDPTKLDKASATGWACAPVIVFFVILYALSLGIRRRRAYDARLTGGTLSVPRNWLETLLVDPSTNTYSLSRLQFLLWLFALVFAYAFVFVTRTQVANIWSFPDLSGAEIAFLISLGTLVGSIATTTVVGPKGAGEVRPSPKDLIVHGGVVALDRAQQLIWTIVAVCIFIRILYGIAGMDLSLPKIPNELLTLMGVSSVGYLAGKAARGAGPVINGVTADPEGKRLHINGMYLSVSARVFVNGEEQSKGNLEPEKPSQNKPEEFADALLIKETQKYFQKLRSVSVINPDGQEAKWEPSGNDQPPPPPSAPPATTPASAAPPPVASATTPTATTLPEAAELPKAGQK